VPLYHHNKVYNGLSIHPFMPTPIEFVFTEEERILAKQEGIRRQDVNAAKGLRGRNGGAWQGSKALDIHLLGATGEVAVASYLGLKEHLFKETEARRDSDDLPGNIDVKTRSNASYDLIVQKREDPKKKFVLVTIENQQTLIHGWCYGEEAMKEEFWADPARGRPAYFFPKEALRSIDELLFA
jgi:hypothetical protein